MTTESNSLARIFAYMAENRLDLTIEAETMQNMDFEAIVEDS